MNKCFCCCFIKRLLFSCIVKLQALKHSESDNQPFIIGGGEIYKLAIENADRIELTRVHTSIEGDAYFPEINTNLWLEVSSEKKFKDDKNEFDYTFYRYNKKN